MEATRTFTARALTSELGRRRNNKAKGTSSRARSWVFSKMDNDDIECVLGGEIVTVEFGSGRVERVGLKAA